MKRLVLFVLIVLLPISGIFAAASKEAASSGNRGRYLSGMGYIIPPGEIQIDSYISQYDYDYPLPKDKPVNTILEVDRKDDVALLMVGLKGKKEPFNDLPPLNISFVIDRSGSMSERDKMTVTRRQTWQK